MRTCLHTVVLTATTVCGLWILSIANHTGHTYTNTLTHDLITNTRQLQALPRLVLCVIMMGDSSSLQLGAHDGVAAPCVKQSTHEEIM